MISISSLHACALAAALASGCSLVVDTADLQAGGAGGGAATGPASSTTTAGGLTSGPTTTGGGGGPASSTGRGAGGDGGGGLGGAGGAGGDGGAGGEGGAVALSWCARNAPSDAFLCADFDTPASPLTNPPWSNTAFEDGDGAITIDEGRASSPPASALVRLTVAEPACAYQALQRRFSGTPERIQIQFDFYGDVVGTEPLIALVDWQTDDGLPCSLLLGLGTSRGFVVEQQASLDTFSDQFSLQTSPFGAWHTLLWSIDANEGIVRFSLDGEEQFFSGNDDFAMDLTSECSDSITPSTMGVRLGPHCSDEPFEGSYDNIVLAPW